MIPGKLEQAKREAVAARRRLDSSLDTILVAISPRNLASEAWDGVKGKSAEVADSALAAVRERPAAVSVAVGAFALFLARAPLQRAVRRVFADEEA